MTDDALSLPPEDAIELACRLADSAHLRRMEYEEYTFEVEGGGEDGGEYRVIVLKL